MKPFLITLVLLLASIFSFGVYHNYQQNQRSSYWLTLANKAVVNNDAKSLEFYNKHHILLPTYSIEEGWNIYERHYK